jgi:hypothetical protein
MDKSDKTIQWLHSTFHNQSSIYLCQLQFTILQIQMQVCNIFSKEESSLKGKLSISLIPPEVLMTILKNFTFFFPHGYVFSGLSKNDM